MKRTKRISGFEIDILNDASKKLEHIEFLFYGEFDPGSGRTLAACLIHASRAD